MKTVSLFGSGGFFVLVFWVGVFFFLMEMSLMLALTSLLFLNIDAESITNEEYHRLLSLIRGEI